MTKILIVEDEGIIAMELEKTLKSLGYHVIGRAMNGDKAIDYLATREVQLALLDINIKGTLSGIDLAKLIRKKYRIPFVFITSYSDQTTLDMVKETMPYGYIVKPFNKNDLRSNIELALFKFESEVKKDIFPSKEEVMNKHHVSLTEREYQILLQICHGKKYKEIARELFLSINTVKTYRKRIFQVFSVSSKFELINIIGFHSNS